MEEKDWVSSEWAVSDNRRGAAVLDHWIRCLRSERYDPLAMTGAAAILALVAVVAALVPARAQPG